MATAQCTTEPANIDLIRRYCPELHTHTPEQIAACILVSPKGCWEWPGPLTPDGYGYVWCEPTPYGYPQSVGIHRYAYDLFLGDIPKDCHVHHRCQNKSCWLPHHLEALTPKQHYDRHHPQPEKQSLPWTPPVQLVLQFD
jgi:hypothetical protein